MRTEGQRRGREAGRPIGERDGPKHRRAVVKGDRAVGVPLPGDTGVIVAVKVTAWPETEDSPRSLPSWSSLPASRSGSECPTGGQEVGVAFVDHGDRVRGGDES